MEQVILTLRIKRH